MGDATFRSESLQCSQPFHQRSHSLTYSRSLLGRVSRVYPPLKLPFPVVYALFLADSTTHQSTYSRGVLYRPSRRSFQGTSLLSVPNSNTSLSMSPPCRLYESSTCLYLVHVSGSTLRVQRTHTPPTSLSEVLFVDTRPQHEITSSCRCIAEVEAVLGFIKLLGFYYIVLCTRKETCGSISARQVHAVAASHIVSVSPTASASHSMLLDTLFNFNRAFTQTSAESAERKYLTLLQCVDLTKEFYFSYDYDLAVTQQRNFIGKSLVEGDDRFVWNHHLLSEWSTLLNAEQQNIWLVRVVHGFYQQRRFSCFSKMIDVTLIARRSRHYAGTRYLKRGLNEKGHVANDCEIEIVDNPLCESKARPSIASFCQMRGSVPVYWSQETSVTVPKPPIVLHRADPSFDATKNHFIDLFQRYGKPILVLDLVKQFEKRRRESIIGREFYSAVEELNTHVPLDMQIRYCGLDFSRMSSAAREQLNESNGKFFADVGMVGGEAYDIHPLVQNESTDDLRRDPDPAESSSAPLLKEDRSVLEELDMLAYYSIHQTSFFCTKVNRLRGMHCISGGSLTEAQQRGALLQQGVMRSNCVDCLDRTNVAQFAVGVRFLATGLFALGLSESTVLQSSSPMLKAFVVMFSDMGDRLALQYGGSEAHKRVANSPTVASTGQAISNQGELLTSIKRYYSNAFTDRMKQDAINLFLGAYIPLEHNVALWDMDSDYQLHHSNEKALSRVTTCPELELQTPPLAYSTSFRMDEDAFLHEIEDMDDEELYQHPLYSKYATPMELTPASGKRLRHLLFRMLQSEQRKEKLHSELHSSNEEEFDCWRKAIAVFNAPLAGLGKSQSYSSIERRRDDVPFVWTSFDEEVFAIKANAPTDSCAVIEYAEDESVSVELVTDTENTSQDAIHREQSNEQLDVIVLNRQLSDDVGSIIGQYVRGISWRAKVLVGGFLSPSTNDPPPKASTTSISVDGASIATADAKWKKLTVEELADFYEVSRESALIYSNYVNLKAPESLEVSGDEETTAKSFYEKTMACAIIDVDDVVGMEKFAAAQGISYTVNEGPYAKLSSFQSAALATGNVDISIGFIESRNCSDAMLTDMDVHFDEQCIGKCIHEAQRDEILAHRTKQLKVRNYYNTFVNEAELSKGASNSEAPQQNTLPALDRGKGRGASRRTFKGFTKIQNGRYQRDANPHLFMNESGADSFSKIMSSNASVGLLAASQSDDSFA